MYKKALLILIIVSILVAGVIGYRRYQLEKKNQKVELILDFNQLDKLELPGDVDLIPLLKEYKDLGVTSLAISEQNLNDLINTGEVNLVSDTELKLLERFFAYQSQLKFKNTAHKESNYTYIFYNNPSLREKLLNRLTDYLEEDKIIGVDRQAQVIAVQTREDRLLELPMGFSNRQLKLAIRSGLKIVPRFNNQLITGPEAIKEKFSHLAVPRESLSQVIFAGDEVLGYPNYLSTTKSLLVDYELKLGVIEPFIAFQKGIAQLAHWPQVKSSRVHSIQQEEVAKMSNSRLVARYFRAVQERNTRSLYLKPILQDKGDESAFKLTGDFLHNLVSKLKGAGYSLGLVQPVPKFNAGKISLLIINLGAMAGLFYLLEYLFIGSFPLRLASKWKFAILSLVILCLAIMIGKGYVFLNREIIALLIAITFPTLGIIAGTFSYIFSSKEGEQSLPELLQVFLKITLITLGGGVLLTGALGDWRYILKVRQFRGIKLAFLGPLVLFILYYLHYYFWLNRNDFNLKDSIGQVKEWLNRVIRLKDILILIFLVIVGIIYIGRTGNNPLLPVPNFEIIIRRWLEALFTVRPRFKSFLIGHPLLILGIWLVMKQNKNWGVPLVFAGLIGQITMLNTISHIHTPLWVSGLRVSLGLALGIVLGLLLVKLVTFLLDQWQKLREELA